MALNLQNPRPHDRDRITDSLPISVVDITHDLSDIHTSAAQSISMDPRLYDRIQITSRVVNVPGKRSPAFVAAKRRELLIGILELFRCMGKQVDRLDFQMIAYPIVQKINAALDYLQQDFEEGNTREALRRVRNTLMNGGWEEFRRAEARGAAEATVLALIHAETVTPEIADAAFNRLFDAGLTQVPSHFDDGDAVADEEDAGGKTTKTSN